MKKIRSTNHKMTAALLVAVMMLSVIFTAVFSGGVKAKAGAAKHYYNFADKTDDVATDASLNDTEFFKLAAYSPKSEEMSISGKKYSNGRKLQSANNSKPGTITFTSDGDGVLTIVCAGAKENSTISVKCDDTALDNTGKSIGTSGNVITYNIEANKNVVISKGDNETWIYAIEFETNDSTEPTEPTDPSTSTTYTVSVVNGTVNGETSISDLNEGDSVTIKADKEDDFAYWVNSSNKIVSTDTSYTFNVYFSDTYTAVYNNTTSKKVVFMTAYNQEYTTVAYDESFSMPEVPARYGYTNGVWEKNAEDIANEFEKTDAKVIQVSPEYTVSSTATYTVKIDDSTTIVGASEAEMQEYKNGKDVPANTIITATTSKSGFTCWKDGKTGEVLSYNKTYSFYVNEDVSLAPKSDKTAVVAGAIRLVNVVTNDDGNTEIIYEFTVPDGCSIRFAGIVADTDKDKVNDKDAKYKGGRASSANTFKYTVTVHKNMVNKLYVKPILKYLDANGVLQTIDNVDAALASTIK